MFKKIALPLTLISTTGHLALAEEAAKIETEEQKYSYYIGLKIGQSIQRQGVKVDEQALLLAIKDALAGKEPRLAPTELQAVVARQEEQMRKELAAKAEKNLAEGKAFRAENKTKEGVTELPSGLQYRVIEAGTGPKPKLTDTVSVHYRGTLIDGKEFDSSHRSGQPASFPVASIIKGWQEALPMMQQGAKWQIVLPPDLAYGNQGAAPLIGPNQTLIFDIELLAIKSGDKDEKPGRPKAE